MPMLPTLGSGRVKGRSPVRILLVDDDIGLRALLRTTFEVADVEVDEAESAAVARERITASRPDVIVLDVAMPRETGLEFCRALKTDPKTRDIPVILLTGSEGSTAGSADEVGAEAYMLKPFSPLELLSVAERLAGGLYGVPVRERRGSAGGA